MLQMLKNVKINNYRFKIVSKLKIYALLCGVQRNIGIEILTNFL